MNEESQDENTDNQHKKKYSWLKPYQWKKGQSGNLEGKPRGKGLKTFVKETFESMTEDEKIDFLKNIDPELVWKMGEGNPNSDDKLEVDIPQSLIELISGITKQTTDKSVSGEDKN